MIVLKENELYIDSDENQYIVRKYDYTNKEGERVYKAITYHQTLKQCIQSLIRHNQYDIVSEKDMTLKEALNEFERINNELINLLNQVVKEGEE